MSGPVSPSIKELAPVILAEIKKASSILLHCHPKPDPDSVGSVLATKLALEQLGKKATVIKGDSDIPDAFLHLPGAEKILKKNFSELDLGDFDLFICLDSSSPQMVTRYMSLSAPMPIKTIIVDHHRSTERFGEVNLVMEDHPATAQVLFDLFNEWGIEMTQEIAANLFFGIYYDTGGLKYMGADARTYEAMATLVRTGIQPGALLDPVENSDTPATLAYRAIILNSIETFLGGKLAIASIPNSALASKNITEADMGGVQVAGILRRVIGWDVDVGLIEMKPREIKMTLRTRDENKYDVSKLAVAFGGGGHKAAAGAGITGKSLEEAKRLVVAKAKELYNL